MATNKIFEIFYLKGRMTSVILYGNNCSAYVNSSVIKYLALIGDHVDMEIPF